MPTADLPDPAISESGESENTATESSLPPTAAGMDLDVAQPATNPVPPEDILGVDSAAPDSEPGAPLIEPADDPTPVSELPADGQTADSLSISEGAEIGESLSFLFPPRMLPMVGYQDGDLWRFVGGVFDDQPVGGLIVEFGGLLEGETTVVSDDGWFEIFASFPPGTNGIVTATVTDHDGLVSDMAVVWVQA